ncbi:hypothetical protein IW262DRAFT_289216 [Armillaria fumosa]|nr:hypothetical protein IW262DRAFT_289216 [Armillaria fumosa]
MTTNPTFSMSTTIGAVLVGATLASALFGVTTMLFFVYYRGYSQDRWFYRLSLAILWILDVLHFVLALHILHFYLIDSFGDASVLLELVWSFKVWSFINKALIVLTQVLLQLDFSIHLATVCLCYTIMDPRTLFSPNRTVISQSGHCRYPLCCNRPDL